MIRLSNLISFCFRFEKTKNKLLTFFTPLTPFTLMKAYIVSWLNICVVFESFTTEQRCLLKRAVVLY